MPKSKDTARKLERDARKAKTASQVRLVTAKADALERIQKLKK